MRAESRCPVIDLVEMNGDPSPWAAYDEIRASGGIAYGEKYGGYWALIDYATVRKAAVDTASFCSKGGIGIPDIGNAVPALPTESDPPEHHQYRKPLIPPLRPDAVAVWTEQIRAITDEAIDTFVEHGTADLVTELAQVVPPAVIGKVLGLADADVPAFVHWSRELLRAPSTGDAEAGEAADAELLRLLDEQVTKARGSGADHLIGMVADAEIDGAPIDHMSAVGIVLALVVAGHSTTVNAISSALWLLDSHPEVTQRLIEHPDRIPAAVEEILRFESPVQVMARTVTEDTDIDGVRLRAGDRVGLVFGAANHDPARFENPHTFDIDRPTNPHLAFGHGIHRCVGEHLARLELRIVLEQVLRRLPDYRVTGDVPTGDGTTIARSPATLTVSFTPGPRTHPATTPVW